MAELKAELVDPDDDRLMSVVLLAELDPDCEVAGSGTWAAMVLKTDIKDADYAIVASNAVHEYVVSTFKSAREARFAWGETLRTFAGVYDGEGARP